jgi:hypothetical protein
VGDVVTEIPGFVEALVDVDLLRWQREQETFKGVQFRVNGVDEADCWHAILTRLESFAGERVDDWTVVSVSFVEHVVESDTGSLRVWEAEVQAIAPMGRVPWA